MICPKCGKNISSTSRYCQFCGFNLNLQRNAIIIILIIFVVLVSFCLIRNKIEKQKSIYFGRTGYKTEDVVNIIYHINKNKMLKNPQNLEFLLGIYGIEKILPYVVVNTKNNNEIEVYTDDNEKLDIEARYTPKPTIRTAYDVNMGK